MSFLGTRVATPKVVQGRICPPLAASTYLDGRKRSRLRSRLLAWYDKSRRDVPWRRTRDPYSIWVSEIMLQQTRVAAVIDRYQQFLSRFPGVRALAQADVSEVLALWSGLGYYRRARAMHQAAREVMASGGVLPTAAEGWRKLPGIGRYTAAAIASIAFGEKCAVVDGNVDRVLKRISGAAEMAAAEMWVEAEAWLSPERPGDFNQAMMDLGATVCLPVAPKCSACTLRTLCATRGELPSKPAEERRKARAAYALFVRGGSILLKQRGVEEKLMPGMWELPEIVPNGHAPDFTLRHSITVTDYRIDVFRMKAPAGSGRWVKIGQLPSVPLTGLARKILRRAEII